MVDDSIDINVIEQLVMFATIMEEVQNNFFRSAIVRWRKKIYISIFYYMISQLRL